MEQLTQLPPLTLGGHALNTAFAQKQCGSPLLLIPRTSRNSWKPPSPSFSLGHCLLFQRSRGVFPSLYTGSAVHLEYCIKNYWKGLCELVAPLLKQSECNSCQSKASRVPDSL